MRERDCYFSVGLDITVFDRDGSSGAVLKSHLVGLFQTLVKISIVNCKVAYMSIDILTKCAYSAKIKLNGLFSKKHLPHS